MRISDWSSDVCSSDLRRGRVLRTDRDDLYRIEEEARSCELNPRKIGSDADEAPGGCNNILITVAGNGTVEAKYSDAVDSDRHFEGRSKWLRYQSADRKGGV